MPAEAYADGLTTGPGNAPVPHLDGAMIERISPNSVPSRRPTTSNQSFPIPTLRTGPLQKICSSGTAPTLASPPCKRRSDERRQSFRLTFGRLHSQHDLKINVDYFVARYHTHNYPPNTSTAVSSGLIKRVKEAYPNLEEDQLAGVFIRWETISVTANAGDGKTSTGVRIRTGIQHRGGVENAREIAVFCGDIVEEAVSQHFGEAHEIYRIDLFEESLGL